MLPQFSNPIGSPRVASRGRAAPVILFAQELGAGYGHLTNLLAVARHFPGAERVFVSPHPALARPLIAERLGAGVPCWPAPIVERPPSGPDTPERTLAEVLDRIGFARAASVTLAAEDWSAMLDRYGPDLIVADYAPTLRIAAAGRVPQVVLGNAFAIPPDTAPVPPFIGSASPDDAHAGGSEGRVLQAANAARCRLRLPDLPRFASLLRGDRTFVAAFPELDLFAEHRSEPAMQPFNVPSIPLGTPLRDRTGPHVFCYLDPTVPATNPVITALNGLSRPSRVFVRDIDPRALAPHCGPQVEVCAGLADYRVVMPGARLVVHLGNQATAGAALLAGTPQLLAPFTLDHALAAERLRGLGVGEILSFPRDADPAGIRDRMERMLADDGLERRARAIAEGMQARRSADPENSVIQGCRALLRSQTQ